MPPRTLRDAAFVGRDQMRSYSPFMAERVPQTLQDLLMRFGMDKFQARKTGKTLGDILALTPVGTLTSAADQYRGIDADLRAGRTPSSFGGGEVALAMLPGGAAAKKGGKLAMDEASRMARAAEQGFTQDLYHGTGSNIAEFTRHRRGLWATDNPAIANIYAKLSDKSTGAADIRAQVADAGPNVLPLKLRGNVLEISDLGPGGSGWFADNLAAALGVEMGGAGTRMARLMNEAKERGYSAVKITGMSDLGGPQTQWSILDPAQVRSRFAAFDPAKRNSANLLASGAGAAFGLPTLSGMTTQNEGER